MARFLLLMLTIVAAMIAAVLVFGPREPVDENLSFVPAAIGSDLEAYLAQSEAKIKNIRPGAQKKIIWSDSQIKQQTEYSVVYLHGFSATLEETRPLPDLLANKLQANLFFTRLKGHGRDGAAMAEPNVNDWLNDTAEAIEIGRRLGKKVIVLGVSTGGTFATWAATKPELMEGVEALVLLSPNFGINNPAARILTLGGARHWVPLLFGAERSFETTSEQHAKWWTTSYPTVALMPMAESVRFVSSLEIEEIPVPAMFVFHYDDTVVNPVATRTIADRWGKNAKNSGVVLEVKDSKDRYNHVIAGRILSPGNAAPIADAVTAWLKKIKQ